MHQLEPKSTEFPDTLDTLEPPTLQNWCPGAESNHRHGDFQSPALPTELPGRGAGRGRMPRVRGRRQALRRAMSGALAHAAQVGNRVSRTGIRDISVACRL